MVPVKKIPGGACNRTPIEARTFGARYTPFGVITTLKRVRNRPTTIQNLATPLAEILCEMNTVSNVTTRLLRLIYNSSSLKKGNDNRGGEHVWITDFS